jgi:WASH complex subunit strumpellin
MDFIDPNNDCGQALLKLAANGSAILAELLRLSNHIPEVFLFDSRQQT